MQLANGARAPQFEGRTHDGRVLRGRDIYERKAWIAFFRYTSCMFCNFRIHEVLARQDELAQAGLRFVGVFQSPPEALAEFVRSKGITLDLLADPEEQLYATFGLETSLVGFLHPKNLPGLVRGVVGGYSLVKSHGSRTRLPADFLIEAGGTVLTSFYGRAISDAIDWRDVESFMARR